MIYIKRILANDIPTGKQFAIPAYIADVLFGVDTMAGGWSKSIHLCFINDNPSRPDLNDSKIVCRLYPYPDRSESRLTVEINNFLRESLKVTSGDIMVIIQGAQKDYFLFRIIRQSDSERFAFYSQFFKDARYSNSRAGGHALIETSNGHHAVDCSEYVDLLKENLNLVLTGAPGTGKTFMAKAIAAAVIGGCSWDELPAAKRAQCSFVQFHPSYDYTDFVEGLRPQEGGEFKREDGQFKDFCKKAYERQEEPFVFIIDEINRGELSKIFGELFFSIEKDYRGETNRVKTQYNTMVEAGDLFKDGFFVPTNILIIGTMNDVDRSVESMDFAIRRRFVWKEISVDDSAMNMGIAGLAKVKMDAVNNALRSMNVPEEGLIGAAYFRKVTDNDFEKLWDSRLRGVITEFFRGDPEAHRKVKAVAVEYKNASITTDVDMAADL